MTNTFAELFRAARESNDQTLADAAELIGVSVQTVSRWEHGYLPAVDHIHAVAKFMNCDPSKLLELIAQ